MSRTSISKSTKIDAGARLEGNQQVGLGGSFSGPVTIDATSKDALSSVDKAVLANDATVAKSFDFARNINYEAKDATVRALKAIETSGRQNVDFASTINRDTIAAIDRNQARAFDAQGHVVDLNAQLIDRVLKEQPRILDTITRTANKAVDTVAASTQSEAGRLSDTVIKYGGMALVALAGLMILGRR